ncbi:MAG TPA: adenosyl-hopene transferase HpnH [Planctomycetaceae bacterium]|nr:adenosyl-hopene transferase HpnH [Planctomycetaceae bacterium]HCK54121.1 adenosyl-hopene transferase HpnH [Planctomycetaceae bacterium]
MAVPISQMWTVARYVVEQRLKRRRRFPLVLMLEPLFRCNLACAGCGKIQHPTSVLRQHLSPQQCFDAADECGAPIVSIPGGEPLLHPEIVEIVEGLVDRGKYVYLCTNALLLKDALPRFQASKYLTFSVHLDGPAEEHDAAVSRDGVYAIAEQAIASAIESGFRVTTNTTLFNTAEAGPIRSFFDRLMAMGVEGMMISPGYPYQKAPDQDHFLHRRETVSLFRRLLHNRPRRWRFNQSPLFLEFLQGHWDLPCTPWGNPTFNLHGWQKPCYLLDEGSVDSFDQLMQTTDWDSYGPQNSNPACTDCMVHSGFEPTAVSQTFGSLRAFLMTARTTLLGPPRRDPPPPEPGDHLLQIELPSAPPQDASIRRTA